MEPREKYSPEFKEIVDRIPDNYSSVLVGGLALFFAMLLVFSFVIKVPDRVSAEIRITSTQSPIVLKAQIQGKIRLLKNKLPCICEADEYIAVLENSANTQHIKLLKDNFYGIDILADTIPSMSLLDSTLYLGNIEPAYFQLRQQRQHYENLLYNNKYDYEIKLYNQQLYNDSINLIQLNYILKNNMRQYEVRHKQYQTDSILFLQRAILESEYNQTYLSYLNAERQIASVHSEIFTKTQSMLETTIRKENTMQEYKQSIDKSKLVLLEAYHNLVTAIKNWENTYVFKSPNYGTVEFVNLITDASFVSAGEPIFDVIFDDNKYFGIALLPSIGGGSVKKGQKVNIKVDLYPYQEYGQLEGVVSDISLSSIDKNYLIYIDLLSGLISSSGHEFIFAETMYGQAEIITENKRLISKVFSLIYKLLHPTKSIITDESESEKEQKSIQF
ncbi:MAG: HlyD family secretion protein [Barnesiella sp.]